MVPYWIAFRAAAAITEHLHQGPLVCAAYYYLFCSHYYSYSSSYSYGSMGRSVGRSVQYEYTVRYYLIASSSLRRCRAAGGGGGAKEGDEHQLHQCNLATG